MNPRYHISLRVLHWLMAPGFVFMWACGYGMTEFVADDSPLQEFLFGLHISIGVTLLFLLATRIVLRLRFAAPPLPQAIPKLERKGAAAGHLALYFLPVIIILAGWMETDFGGHGVEWFGVAMPKIFPTREFLFGVELEEILAEIHEIAAYTMLTIAAIHIAAVIKHRRDGHDVLSRITIGNRR